MHVNAGDTAWMLTSTALVFFMMPGLALFSERMRFRGYLVFIGLWSLLVYSPFAHSEWGGGFLGTGGLHSIDLPAARWSMSWPARRRSPQPST